MTTSAMIMPPRGNMIMKSQGRYHGINKLGGDGAG